MSTGLIESPSTATASTPAPHSVQLDINGTRHTVDAAPWTTLLDLLRERLHFTGTKKGCDHGQCGACTVLVNGERILSCLTLAVMHDGSEVTTVEALAGPSTSSGRTDVGSRRTDVGSCRTGADEDLHPLQQSFLRHDAFQCGYCTPGQLCSALGLIHEGHARTLDDIRELMSGNLCRCGAYIQIAQAVAEVALGPGEHKVDPARRPVGAPPPQPSPGGGGSRE
jgi:xanthine dehydrogenase YagT iron-sulfur-binding subunit